MRKAERIMVLPTVADTCCRLSILTVLSVFAGKDPSRALATSSLKAEDCVPEWSDLDDSHKTVLGEWYTFFSKRYNVVGQVSPLPLGKARRCKTRLMKRNTDHRCGKYRVSRTQI